MKTKEEKNIYMKQFRHSLNGVLMDTYFNQKQTSKRRSHPMPNYTLQELKNIYLHDPAFISIYMRWAADGYGRWDKPSLDRTDDSKSYTLNNLQVMTWKQNHYKGTFLGTKSVVMTDKEGQCIKIFESARAAGKETGIHYKNISACCLGKQKTAKGYRWAFQKEER